MATLGYTSTPTFGQWGEGFNVGNQVAIQTANVPSPGIMITDIHCYAASFNGTNTMKLVIWDANGNVLTSVNANTGVSSSPAWVQGSFTAPGFYVASGSYLFIGWGNPNNTSGNSGFTAWYDSVAGTAKWNLNTPAPQNILNGTNPTQYTNRQIGTYVTYVLVPVPVVSSASPTHGAWGDAITLTGSGFTYATAVSFNGTAASFTVVNDTTITTAVPTGATSGNVSVTNPSGTGSLNFPVSRIFVFDGTNLKNIDWRTFDGAALQLPSVFTFDGASLRQVG